MYSELYERKVSFSFEHRFQETCLIVETLTNGVRIEWVATHNIDNIIMLSFQTFLQTWKRFVKYQQVIFFARNRGFDWLGMRVSTRKCRAPRKVVGEKDEFCTGATHKYQLCYEQRVTMLAFKLNFAFIQHRKKKVRAILFEVIGQKNPFCLIAFICS